MMYLDDMQFKMAKNAKIILESTKGKNIFLYPNQKDENALKGFMEKFMEPNRICELTDWLKEKEKICVVTGKYYLELVGFLFEKGEIDETEKDFLSQVRYSNHEWVLPLKNLCVVVMENILFEMGSNYIRKKDLEEIYQVSFHLVDHCNLKCQMCNKCSPIAENHFTATESIIMDATNLGRLTKHNLKIITFTGGEPLMHPDLERIVKEMHLIFPKAKIRIQSNGILLKDKEVSFYKMLAENNAEIFLTKYPIALDYESIINHMTQNNVEAIISGGLDGIEEIKTSWYSPIDPKGSQEKFWVLFCWLHGHCMNVHEGKFWPCGFSHASRNLERYYGYNLKRTEEDTLELNETTTYEDLSEWLTRYKPFCAHCEISQWKKNIPWQRSTFEKKEWVKEDGK